VADIPTTAGPLDPSELGRMLIHEHLLTASEAVRFQFPHLYDAQEELDRAIEWTQAAKSHGVKTIGDPACMDISRDVQLNLRVTEATDVPFVMATGVYGMHYRFLPHYFQNREIDALVGALVHDVEEGIQGTDVRAAFLKCAADEPGITEDVEKVHRAVAQASKRTGAPIMAHSRPASRTGLDQMALFEDEGIDPAKVQIAHTGDTDDLDYIEELLGHGCLIGMDRYGLDMFLPTDRRNATVVELCKRGYADRMTLSQDAVVNFDWFPPELRPQLAPKWTFTYLFEEIIPALLEAGVTQEQIDTMLVDVPRRWLTA
jgi:phosphotriesterase-related protein